LLSSTV